MLRVRPHIMKNENIICSNAHDNDDHKYVKNTKVLDLQYALKYEHRQWNAHDNLDYTHQPQEQASLVLRNVQEYK
jgi:hypothetical protein